MKNHKMFKTYMATLGEIHDKVISPLLMELYWKTLEPFTDEECERALKAMVTSQRFFPKPVDILEAIQGKKENQGTEAWLKTLNAVKRIGNYQSVSFDDKAIHSVIDAMGGWEKFCMMLSEEEKWKQKEFEKLYAVISARPGTHAKYLPGTHEMVNDLSGHRLPVEIVMIGNDGQKLIEDK